MQHEESILTQLIRGAVAGAMAAAATAAFASFHTFEIEQVYSNADGTVQFVVLHEAQGANGENGWSGHTFTSTHAGVAKTFTFPADLPGAATAGKRVLLGTAGLAALGLIAPDYVIPNGFLATDGATLDYAGVDTMTYASLPADGLGARNRAGAAIPNVATNFAGKAVSLPALLRDFRRVLQRRARPLLHQQSAARHRRAGHGAHSGLGANGAVVQGLSQPGQRRGRRQSRVPLLHSSCARQFALLLRIAGGVQYDRSRSPRPTPITAATSSNRLRSSSSRCPIRRRGPVPPTPRRSTGFGTSAPTRIIATRGRRRSRRR